MTEHPEGSQPVSQQPWQVVIIRHGTRTARKSEAFMNYAFYGEADGDYTTDYYLWVLRRGDETILVDTGYSAAGAEKRGRTVLIDPVEALARIGVTPEQAPPIVVTHAHYDHIGNISRFAGSELHIASSEYEFWTGEIAKKPLFSHFGDPHEVDDLSAADREGRLVRFSGEHALRDGIRLVEVGGHTPGQVMVEVDTSEGLVLLASDACHFVEELERDWLFASMADIPESYRALETIREHPADHLVTGHDPASMTDFEAYGEPLDGIATVIGRRP